MVIHRDEVEDGLYEQSSGMGLNEVEEGEEDFGMEGSGGYPTDGTYIDDEDLNQSQDRIEIPIHCTAPKRKKEELVCS